MIAVTIWSWSVFGVAEGPALPVVAVGAVAVVAAVVVLLVVVLVAVVVVVVLAVVLVGEEEEEEEGTGVLGDPWGLVVFLVLMLFSIIVMRSPRGIFGGGGAFAFSFASFSFARFSFAAALPFKDFLADSASFFLKPLLAFLGAILLVLD